MRQGRASTDKVTGTKVEPNPHAVSPEAVEELGDALAYRKHTTVYQGRGLKAPMVGETQHHCGSQGKH